MDTKQHIYSNEQIREEARRWVVSFNSDCAPTASDIQALKEWSARSAAHRQELQLAEAIWCDADLLARLAVPRAKQKKSGNFNFLSKLTSQLISKNWAVPMVMTSLLLLVGLVSSLYWPLSIIDRNGVYQTAVGKYQALTLEDASFIHLDTDSRVRIAYTEGRRKVYLLRGKAHFEVAKNPARPFEVYAGSGRVLAVGTAFTVYLKVDDVEVIVDEGSVNLARLNTDTAPDSDKPKVGKVFLTLDKGQGARFDNKQEVVRVLADNDLDRELAWRRGLLIFAGDSLEDVINEVNRYTSTTIEITDPDLRKLQIGGRFRTGELEALFDVLKVGFGVQVSYVNEGYVQLKSNKKSIEYQ